MTLPLLHGHNFPFSKSGVNLGRKLAHVKVGVSNRVFMSEVKNYQPTVRDCGQLANVNCPDNIPAPNADPRTIALEYAASGCAFFQSTDRTAMYQIALEPSLTFLRCDP